MWTESAGLADGPSRLVLLLRMQEKLGLRKVAIHSFARMNFMRTVLSKRHLGWFVEEGRVEGWNDPRFPTVQGVLRRGVRPEALRDFMLQQVPEGEG